MSPDLDEAVVEQVERLGTVPWSGTVHRCVSSARDPLSGEGARLNGGRWNPRGLFPTIYLAEPFSTCVEEMRRTAEAAGMTLDRLIARGYTANTIVVQDLDVLDLRDDTALQQVGLERSDLTGRDWSACQSVGHASWFLAQSGLIAPSATGQGVVLAAFEERFDPGQVTLTASKPFTVADA